MTRTLILSALSAVMVGLGGYVYLTASQSADPMTSQPFMAASAQESDDAGEDVAPAEAATPEIMEMAIGAEDAPITVIEYASMTCPHCATFHAEVYPRLIENYVDTGQVRFVMREVYFDRPGLWATMVARCGGEMRYFGIVEMLMEDQREWVQGQPAEILENLRRIGRRAGLEDAQIDACMTEDFARGLYSQYEAHLEEHDISGTPSFVINGELYSNMGYSAFADILDGLLADAEG